MRNMPELEARAIYKEKFWDKIKGDKIKSQLIANFVADMKSSGGGVRNFQRALNTLGANISTDGNFGNITLEATNKLLKEGKEVQLNNAFRVEQIKYYKSLSNQAQNWYDSLDKDYPHLYEIGKKKLAKEDIYLIIVLSAVTLFSSFFIYKKFKK